MPGILVKYNKVTNLAFDVLVKTLSRSMDIEYADLTRIKTRCDLINQSDINKMMSKFKDVGFIVIGDIYWTTGQGLCQWAINRHIPCFFLQHGVWKYITNKKDPKFYPSHILVYGDKIKEMTSSWPLAKKAKFCVTGNPRYDQYKPTFLNNNNVYFSPPVVQELQHGLMTGPVNRYNLDLIKSLQGLDDLVHLYLQPHYREGSLKILKELFPNAIYCDISLDPLPFLSICSKIVCSRDSTMVLDAITTGCKVIFTEYEQKFDKACFFQRGYFGNFGIESKSKVEFFKNVQKDIEISEHNYMEDAKPYIYLGNSSKRIGSIIKGVLNV